MSYLRGIINAIVYITQLGLIICWFIFNQKITANKTCVLTKYTIDKIFIKSIFRGRCRKRVLLHSRICLSRGNAGCRFIFLSFTWLIFFLFLGWFSFFIDPIIVFVFHWFFLFFPFSKLQDWYFSKLNI